jgi:hypothetical protein
VANQHLVPPKGRWRLAVERGQATRWSVSSISMIVLI